MKVKPMLGDWEIPRISDIRTLERRAFVELPVPGRVGSLFQDLDSTPTRIAISGSLFGDEKRDEFLEAVRAKYREGAPVTFVADIVTATEVQYVVVETLDFRESATRPDEMHYSLVLRESPPPPPPPDPFGGIDAGLLDQVSGLVDAVTGALAALDALANLPEISDPTPPLQGMLDDVSQTLGDLGGTTGPLSALFGGGS